MSSNYGYDANGWEREPFPARDEHEPERRPKVVDLMAALEASLAAAKADCHERAMAAHPGCEPCRRGQSIIQPGPGHCKTHDQHCSAAPCW